MLLLIAAGQFFGMTLWFSATAAAPALATEFSITSGGTAWLTMAVQGGFVAGTLISAILNLADVFNARRLFAMGCIAGAVANGAIAFAESAWVIIALRFATGVALACVYPPGLKIAAGWFLDRRGTALGVVVGALTVGSAFPHLLAWGTASVSWRSMLVASSALALLGAAIVGAAVKDGPYVSASAPFDPHALAAVGVVRDVDVDSGVRRGLSRRIWLACWTRRFARGFRQHRQRCNRLRAGRALGRRVGKGPGRGGRDGCERKLLRAGGVRLRRAAAGAPAPGHRLGLLHRGGLRTVFGARR
jgi:MFS family permease